MKTKHQLDVQDNYILYTTNAIVYTLLGGISFKQLDRLRVTLKINPIIQYTNQTIRHNLDLYNDDQVEKFIRKCADKLEVSTSLLREEIHTLTELLEEYRLNSLEAMEEVSKVRELTEDNKKQAIKYLKQKKLIESTNRDIGLSGVIGEEINRMIVFIIFISRLRENPLHLISMGASGTGKTYLQEQIAALIPSQDKLEITSLTGNALYYFGKQELQHKLLLIEDLDGAENAFYPIRELMSKRKISKTIVVKTQDGTTRAITLQVNGPVAIAGTTTKEAVYEDNSNRSILIYINQSKQHQEQIMSYQRQVSAGKFDNTEAVEIKELFKDINTVLKPIKIVNPYAEQLVLNLPLKKPLRTNQMYLNFIETITFYHQYQRKIQTNDAGVKYIETTKSDIQIANTLLAEVFLYKTDEIPKTVRDFLEKVKEYLQIANKSTFTTKVLMLECKIPKSTIHYYIKKLVKLGYIERTGGNKYVGGYIYQLQDNSSYNQLQNNISTILQKQLDKL